MANRTKTARQPPCGVDHNTTPLPPPPLLIASSCKCLSPVQPAPPSQPPHQNPVTRTASRSLNSAKCLSRSTTARGGGAPPIAEHTTCCMYLRAGINMNIRLALHHNTRATWQQQPVFHTLPSTRPSMSRHSASIGATPISLLCSSFPPHCPQLPPTPRPTTSQPVVHTRPPLHQSPHATKPPTQKMV